MFTNESREQVLQWFAGFAEKDFARAGYIATEEVTLAEGYQLVTFTSELGHLKIRLFFFMQGP